MTELEKFHQKFKIPAYTIRKFQHWTWSLRPLAATLGAGVLSANRYEPNFSGMSAEECAELAAVVKEIEGRLKTAFAYDKINYLMLMMNDPHVHMHVIPRYAGPREFAGTTWTDESWPKPPNATIGPTLSDDQAKAIIGCILKG